MAWDFLPHVPPKYLFLIPDFAASLFSAAPAHLYTDAYARIYLSICLADAADIIPLLKMAILTH